MKKYGILLFVCFLCNTLLGQNKMSSPYSFTHQVKQDIEEYNLYPQFKVMNPNGTEQPSMVFDTIEDEIIIIDNPTIGELFQTDIDIDSDGVWETLENNDQLWRLKINSLEGKYMMLTFDQFYLPEGVSLFIYSEDRRQLLGAFTDEDNALSKKFTSSPIRSNSIILELHKPAFVKEKEELRIEFIGLITVDMAASVKENITKGFGDSDNPNVNCFPSYYNQKRSVVLIITPNKYTNGINICSGSLINNEIFDGRPLLLTAMHCLYNNASIRDELLENSLFIFNYESPGCDNPSIEPSRVQSISGARFLDGSDKGIELIKGSDYAVLLLSKVPPKEYNAYYNGWYAGNKLSQKGYSIHHPVVDIKKIMFWEKKTNFSDNAFWKFKYSMGKIQPGSSGAPFFNDEGKVVGQIYGQTMFGKGLAGCLYKSYKKLGLKKILAPGSTENMIGISGLNLSRVNWYFNYANDLHTSNNTLRFSGMRRYNGVYSAQNEIIAENTYIRPNTTVVFEAGREIILKSGFHADRKCSFIAKIENVPYMDSYGNKPSSSKGYEEDEIVVTYEDELEEEQDESELIKMPSSKRINSEENQSYRIYPNPNNGTFYIALPSYEERVRIQILNTIGNIILEKEYTHKHQVNIPNPIPGVYIVKIITPNKIVVKQIVIK